MVVDIAIIGAGASGLIAAIEASKKYSVLVLEKNSKIGKKLLATGNGRCNISNIKMNKNFFNTSSSNKKLISSIISDFDYFKTKKYFQDLGLLFYESEDGRVFPYSLQASSVVDILLHNIKNVKLILNSNVLEITKKRNFIIKTNNQEYQAKRVIIATGGKSMSLLGSNGSGFEFAKAFGHTINRPFASLVQLNSNYKFLYILNGFKQEAKVTAFINNKQKATMIGDILFTKYGVSGLTILDLSYYFGKNGFENSYIEIDFFYKHSKDELKNMIKKLFQTKKDFVLALNGLVNKKLAIAIKQEYGFDNYLNTKQISSLAHILKHFKITITSLRDFKYSEVTAGGVSLDEVSLDLESKKIKNLFFCGEVLDVDGNRGGYNLQWAWSSGYKVGNNKNL